MTQLTKDKIEDVLLNKIKFIGDGDQTYLGTPQELIDDLNEAITQILKEVVGEEMMRHNPSKELRDVQVIAYMEGYNQAKQEINKRIKEMGY